MWNPSEGATPLTFATPNTPLVCTAVLGGQRVRQRLGALGILPGTPLILVETLLSAGPVIVEVRGTRLALGRGMAAKVLVAPTGPPPGQQR